MDVRVERMKTLASCRTELREEEPANTVTKAKGEERKRRQRAFNEKEWKAKDRCNYWAARKRTLYL